MFEVEKPRKFHYEPRFYDPEKEKWEALKQKYADEKARSERLASETGVRGSDPEQTSTDDADLAYFQERVRQLDRDQKHEQTRLGWKDLFRKREMPQFHYVSRFDENGNLKEPQTSTEEATGHVSAHRIKIRRRFDISDSDYLKPISGGKIILYCFLVCLLLYWILF